MTIFSKNKNTLTSKVLKAKADWEAAKGRKATHLYAKSEVIKKIFEECCNSEIARGMRGNSLSDILGFTIVNCEDVIGFDYSAGFFFAGRL